MIRILVLSDSHRNLTNMYEAVDRVRPDRIFHLGDHYQDAKNLHGVYPDIPLDAVRGNCDFGSTNLEKLITVEGKRIFLTHGHLHHVKSGFLSLEYAAREKEADVVLFGHTHLSFTEERDGLCMMNPGSIGEPRDPGGPTCGLLIIENGEIFMRILTI